jgi:hypothetical protein
MNKTNLITLNKTLLMWRSRNQATLTQKTLQTLRRRIRRMRLRKIQRAMIPMITPTILMLQRQKLTLKKVRPNRQLILRKKIRQQRKRNLVMKCHPTMMQVQPMMRIL